MDTITGQSVAVCHRMLSVARLPKNVGSAREAFINWIVPVPHFLAYLASFIKHYAARRCRRMKASNMLARRLQRNACECHESRGGSASSRRGRLWGVDQTGAWVGPLFFALPHGNQTGISLEESEYYRNYHAPAM